MTAPTLSATDRKIRDALMWFKLLSAYCASVVAYYNWQAVLTLAVIASSVFLGALGLRFYLWKRATTPRLTINRYDR